jgi:asparagine synthase (glutamine-hydrolysing)
MCGIAGIAARDGLRDSDPVLLDRMLHSIRHRGPDDQYTLASATAILGTRRLSIIDLDGGRQPLTDESGQVIATQNGEIYNYIELREELERQGHVFRTQGDTEAIVHLYEEHGTAFVDHLRGMFAIALWDGRTGQLVLARDRLGKKPLYWHLAGGRLTYGSELKVLLEDPEVERQVDREALALYLQYQYIPAPCTILRGVSKLPPASVLTWDGEAVRVERYWSPEYEPKSVRTLGEDVEEGLSILRESVQLRLRSDVPVGIFLSGGMDSSIVTALAAESSATPLRTFSIGFEETGFDELPYARAVASQFGTVHTEEVVRLDAMELLPHLADHFDEPNGDSSAVPTYRVSQLAAEHVKVVLTGDGGDESFGGYPRYLPNWTLTALGATPSSLVRVATRAGKVAFNSNVRLMRRLEVADAMAGQGWDEQYLNRMALVPRAAREQLLGNGDDEAASRYLLDVLRAGPPEMTDRLLRADLLTYLPEALLVKVDRASMANSLEARSPLLDHKLVEFAARLPVDRKIKSGQGKILLREIGKQFMPADHIDRPKMGFGIPASDWFSGPLGDRYRELVLAPDSATRDHLESSVCAELLDKHRSIGGQHDALWLLLMFELWARRWLRPAVALT